MKALSLLGVGVLAGAVALGEEPSRKPLVKKRVDPKEFGIQGETIRVIHASEFAGDFYVWSVYTDDLARVSHSVSYDAHYYATLDVPAGAVIDFIGLNSASDTDGILGVELWERHSDGSKISLAAFSVPAHGWDTDLVGPLNVPIVDRVNREYVVDVENGVTPDDEPWAWVEVHWHRTVSPPPSGPSFADVPPGDPFYPFIEAIHAAGITAGCGGGNFCPNQAITRKQEAAFIAKALGLHWPH
jgi:hypothetical protein